MLLSIVMMIKDEERYLDETLSAIKLLMDKVNSELIILDTGSEDNSINIAKKYTKSVYFEKWNNNFSDMRNKSIDYAKGEWILIVDADEVIVNYDRLIEFFNTDLHKKYNSASIELMNIDNEDGTEYDICSIPRLFKNEDGFCYEGAIHEQPKCKLPIYNDIASFKHYGYMFKDKEILNKKLNRNTEILIKEICENPNNPYINYQLGKNYCMLKSYEDGIFFMEKSLKIYINLGRFPIFVILDLAKLYSLTNNHRKCEELCLHYIKKDKKNIDIYYYLAISQSYFGKIKDSIKSYERYLYLLENYSISTQSKSIECVCETIKFKDLAKIKIIENYYKLENYTYVIKLSENINVSFLNKIYYILIHSLYKLGKFKEITDFYNKLKSEIQKNKLLESIEELLLNIRESDKELFYKLLSDIDGNYGKLNKLRLGNDLDINEYNKILKQESSYYFGDIIYYGTKKDINLHYLLEDLDLYTIESYFKYLIKNKIDIEMILYDFIDSKQNTFNFNNLKIYSTICKLLCKYSNLYNEKYKIIFLSYITYRYDYLQIIYNQSKIKEDLSNIIIDKDDKFILEIYNIMSMYKLDKLSFLKNIKYLIRKYPEYSKGIKYIINDIEKECYLNPEIDNLKKEYKSIIERNINLNNISEVELMIKEYEDIFGSEELYNIKAIINLHLGNIKYSEKLLNLNYIRNPFDEDTIFNIAYIKEINKEYDEAIYFYEKFINISKDEKLKDDIRLKIKGLVK